MIIAGFMLGIVAIFAIRPPCAVAQVKAEETTRRLKPAAGLEATLWAAEPLLVNPTNIDVDSRGRVWVAEGLNYRLTRGGNRRFHRIEEADKIKILEDTDGDGKADKATVFADRVFPVPMGIAVEEHHDKAGKYTGCRVFVGNSPDLLVLEDTDGDDKADKRYPLLDRVRRHRFRPRRARHGAGARRQALLHATATAAARSSKITPNGRRTSTWSTRAAGTSRAINWPTRCGSIATARSSRSSATASATIMRPA